MPSKITVKLLTAPKFPLETLFLIWENSKHNRPLPSAEALHRFVQLGSEVRLASEEEALLRGYGLPDPPSFNKLYCETVRRLLTEDVPVLQSLHFSFTIEGVPIALREQMVRHTVGSQIGPRLGADIVPDVSESAFWIQSHRVLDMSQFFQEGRYFVPESIKGNHRPTKLTAIEKEPPSLDLDPTVSYEERELNVEQVYFRTLNTIQAVYAALVEAGVPAEDARNLIPLGATHRLTWTLNLKAIGHIIGKRSCWIMQRGLWEQVIAGMIDALEAEVDPIFRRMVDPPCFHQGKWAGCPYPQSNLERISGKDSLPPCPLYLHLHKEDATRASENCWEEQSRAPRWSPYQGQVPGGFGPENWATAAQDATMGMAVERRAHEKLWKRNVDTGEPVSFPDNPNQL